MQTPQPTNPVPVTKNSPEPADARARRLIRLARARGVLDLALGQGLRALSKGDRLSKEGAAKLTDFAREHLGLGRSCALGLVRLAEQLPVLPRLRAALQAGELTSRQVLTALPLAAELPDAALVTLALRHTIRQVQSLVDASGRSPDEPFDSAVLLMTPGQQARLEAAFEFARTELGANAPDWRCLEALCQEYANLGTTPDPGEDFRPDLRTDAQRWLETWREFGAEVETLERKLAGGAPASDGAPATDASDGAPAADTSDGAPAADTSDGAPAAAAPQGPPGPFTDLPPGPFTDLPADWLDPDTAVLLADALATIDAESAPVPRPDDARLTGLRAHLVLLADARTRWQVAFGRLAREVRRSGAWRSVSRTWGEFCHHELGLDPKTVRERIRFEEALLRFPPLRAALLGREVNYSAAQIVARHARPDTLQALLARAKVLPVLDLRAELEGERKRKMCERDQMPVSGPRSILAFTKDAIGAAQLTAWVQGEPQITPGEAQARIADHFVKVWTEAVLRREDRRARVLMRNGGLCVVPGCSNAAAHVHHIVFRSHGGSTEDWNLAGVCASHHLHCIHLGFMRVRGRADGVLVFEMGLRGGRPVEVYTMAAGEAPRRVPVNGPAGSVEAPREAPREAA